MSTRRDPWILVAGRRLISQALHVHIGLPDAETAISVCDAIRQYLPVFLALTASSPFFEGEDSGFCSYRTNLFKALPRSGIPETLGSWEKFHELIAIMNEATLLNGIRELWWDVRPHPDFGTVEKRICDLPSRFDEILGMAALIQAVVAMLVDESPPSIPYREVIMQNKWHASRYGLDGVFVGQRRNSHTTMAKAAISLLERVTPVAKGLGGAAYLPVIQRVINKGTSAARQRRLFAESGDFSEVIHELREEFWK